ncbi:hypothetical protein NUW58_g8731 [Xylaria curta]|uniref:Uncharacterized protein n=1 Tax=Xylaria curta TaxID=42375 RepID=A0ACC1N601_9PEZI|nr:hypothetical protein NUW58_g8731 [Xylaria curta]
MATIAAGIAATAAGLTYIDGKYHIRQDLKMMRAKSKGAKMFQKAVQERRISPYYFFERHAQAHPGEECIWCFEPESIPPTLWLTTKSNFAEEFED